MRPIGKFRFSIGALMMFVLMVAAGAALFVKILEKDDPNAPPVYPIEALVAIVLPTIALGAWRNHTATQIMLQATLVCLVCLSAYWSIATNHERAVSCWYQSMFALTITLPMLVRRHVKATWPRGPRRESWKKTCEAVLFSFLTFLIMTIGNFFQFLYYDGFGAGTHQPPGAGIPAPILPDPALLDPPPTLAPSLPPKTP